MTRIFATVEYLRPCEAIVSMTDSRGEWAGGGLVQCRSGRRADLYEAGYKLASLSATSKGGRLESFREAAP